jgi:hypothetical protein
MFMTQHLLKNIVVKLYDASQMLCRHSLIAKRNAFNKSLKLPALWKSI